jgi:hypothetical protein
MVDKRNDSDLNLDSEMSSGRTSRASLEADTEAGEGTPRHSSHTHAERELAPLPPVDGGRGAWSFLIAATLVETIVWGIPWSIGVMHHYWASEMFPGEESTLTLAATLQTGLMYMTAAVLGPWVT